MIFTLVTLAAAVVGLERTYYSVSESDGTLLVCAVLSDPSGTCPLNFTFIVDIQMSGGNAGKYRMYALQYFIFIMYKNTSPTLSVMDYSPVATRLRFNRCARRECVVVSIIDDINLENSETFHMTLVRTPGLAFNITLHPVNGVVEISDNDGNTVLHIHNYYTLVESLKKIIEGHFLLLHFQLLW